MADPRFFTHSGALRLEELVALTGATPVCADGSAPALDRSFRNVAPLDRAMSEDVGFLDNIKYVDVFAASDAGACFVRERFAARAPKGMVLLITEEPYFCYAQTARRFYPDATADASISPDARIAPSAKIGARVRIDAFAVVGEHVVVGDDAHIGAGVHIDRAVEIGEHSRIGANSTLSHCVIGKRVLIHRGVHIGQDGFGFAAGRGGMVKVPQLGRVLVHDDVEIGSGTCIDRGAGPDTIIGSGSKLDNLVQIGHNVHIGRSVVIAAQVGVAGSTQIGDGVMLGGQVGIAGHVRIGSGVKLAAQAGVMADIPPGATYGGSPAIPIKEWHRQTATVAKMSKPKSE